MEYSFDKSLGNLSRVISKSLGANLEKRIVNNHINLTSEHWSIISLLHHVTNLNQNAIAKAFGFDKVRVLRILNKLETEKIITRTTDELDKRSRIVNLTEYGMILYKEITPLAQETLNDAFKSFTDEEVLLYMKLSKKIIENLN